MARVGIGGVLCIEIERGKPKGKADFGGAALDGAFQTRLQRSPPLGLKINMNNDAGWSGSGGPWITPELSMQEVVASETFVGGALV